MERHEKIKAYKKKTEEFDKIEQSFLSRGDSTPIQEENFITFRTFVRIFHEFHRILVIFNVFPPFPGIFKQFFQLLTSTNSKCSQIQI